MNSFYRPSAAVIQSGRLVFLVLMVLLGGQSLHAGNGPCLYIDDYDFGVLRPGQSVTRIVRICNLDTGYITFGRPGGGDVITWLENGFSISDADKDKLKNTVLGPGRGIRDSSAPSCVTINLTFTATQTGVFKTTARLWADTRNCRDTSIWTVVVTAPAPQITGYDWHKQWVTTLNSCTKNTLGQYEGLIYVFNDGSSPYNVQSLQIAGSDNAYFKLDNSDSATTVLPGLQIKPGNFNKRAQKILFTPDGERNYMAMMRLITGSGDTVMSILQGIGIESHISLAGKDFGSVEFKGAETTRVSGKVDLTIEPTRPTTITGLTLSGTEAADFRLNWGAAPAPYNYQPTVAAPWVSIAPGTHITIPVDFVPSSPGSKTAYLTIAGDFSECDTSTVPLRGTAITSLSVEGGAVDQVALSADRTGIFTLSLPHAAAVTLDLHDASGNRVARLTDGMMEAGTHRITSDNRELASGLYLYRLSIDGTVRTGRVVVVR